MRRRILASISVFLPACAATASLLVSVDAFACGGFFCDNVQPVVQTAERILFRVEDDGTITTVVEVQYQGPPGNFGWVVPIPEAIDPETIETVEPGFFDALEELTAPVFEAGVEGDGGLGDASAEGCGFDGPAWSGAFGGEFDGPPDTSGVDVVGDAVVGPYEIQVITAEQGDNLANWLVLSGYQIPPTAAEPMQHYIDRGAAFLGLRLAPDLPAGPIDSLVLRYPSPLPSIPLILTAVACAPELELVAYVAAPSRYAPANWVDLDFDYQRVAWVTEGETDYETWLRADIDAAGGRAFNTEQAQPLHRYPEIHHAGLSDLLPRDLYLTRFHTFVRPQHMTVDPAFQPSTLPDVDNHHFVGDWEDEAGGDTLPDPSAALCIPALLSLRRRGRSPSCGPGATPC